MEEVIPYTWGYEVILSATHKYTVSLFKVFNGHSTAFKFHKIATHTLLLIKGKAKVYFRDPGAFWFNKILHNPTISATWHDLAETEILEYNRYFCIRPGQIYQIEAIEDCEFYLTRDAVFEDDTFVLINGK